ncbi:hypothetical protein Emag_007407 [Eimeria magna]
MVATRRMVRASTSAQRTRRVVARATPPRPKRSRSASTTSATRDAAGLPPRTRAGRALLTTAADPAPLRRSLSPARSSSDHRLNDLQYVAHLAINFDTLARTYPVRGEHRPQDASAHTLNDDLYRLGRPASRHTSGGAARASNAAGAPASADSTHTKRAPPGAAPGQQLFTTPRSRAPGSTGATATLRCFATATPGAADASPSPPANADPRPTTPPPADPPAAQRAVFCAAPPAPGASATPPANCNHTRLGTPPRAPKAPTHARAWATIDGVRCEATSILSTLGPGARLRHGRDDHTLQVLGRVALEVRLAPLKTTAPFFVVPGVAFAALLGVDFLYEHEIASDVVGDSTTLAAPGTAPAPPLVYLVAPSTLSDVGLAIPEQLTSGLIALHPAPPPTDGATDTPPYEGVPGGFIPTLPSPNSCLLPAELQQLCHLLHEFRDRFNDGSEPLPATSLLKARLDTGDAQPISTPPRRLSPVMRQAVREGVAELDAQGITEPSAGCWSTPIVMFCKASGAWPLCCYYRAINKHVRIPQQPLPRTDDILASFNGKKYFSVLDMCKGFHQIEIAEEDRPKTSFVTPDCQRQYRRLPFGFASSLTVFQRIVDLLLGGMKWVSAAAARQKDFTWTPAADTAWRALCKALSTEPVLAHPDYTRLFYLDCDGSGDGLNAVLLQPYDEGERVVAYASCSLLDHERKWTATELEAAALIWALETATTSTPSKFKVIHRPGAQQKHVDCLSRAPVPPTPTQRPIILDEFPSLNHVAHSAHRRMRLLRHRLRHMCAAVRAAGSPVRSTPSGSEDDTDVQVCLTDSDDDSTAPPTAQLPDNAPPKHFRQEWDVVLPAAVLAYRCTPHSVTRFSPFFLVTGQELALWRCRLAVLLSHQRVVDANRKLFLEDPHRLEPGMHVALRPLLGRLKASTTAELVDPVPGTKLLANRTRLKFLDAPQSSATPLASLPQVVAPKHPAFLSSCVPTALSLPFLRCALSGPALRVNSYC